MSSGQGELWIVATPIGSIDDLGPRARQVLATVDLILAEDTRRTRSLLSRAKVATPARLRSLHEHNEEKVVPEVMSAIQEGRSVALVSDAGTPVLSDPGFVLIREARRLGLRVLSIPGASAFTAALAASGQPPLPVTMSGFLPRKAAARSRRIRELAGVPWTVVLLLSPHRLASELAELAEAFGRERPATLLAELSKLHERATMASLGELVACAEAASPRGEYVLVVGPQTTVQAEAPSAAEIRAEYEAALARGIDRRTALHSTAEAFGLRRREVYQALFLADERPCEEPVA